MAQKQSVSIIWELQGMSESWCVWLRAEKRGGRDEIAEVNWNSFYQLISRW